MNSASFDTVGHLNPEHWAAANRRLLAKTLAEFSHERLLQPAILQQVGRVCEAQLSSPDGDSLYRFTARRYALDHWLIDPQSLCRTRQRHIAPLSVLDFIVEFQQVLGLGPDVLPIYLEELNGTLAAHCYQLAHQHSSASELAHADFQTIEAGMMEGHPAFVANHGRVGFGLGDYRSYAPEAGQALQLVWLAVHRHHTQFTAIDGLGHEALLEQELGQAQLQAWRRQLQLRSLRADAYLLMPVHPWQWQHKIGTAFASDIASGDIVPLGRSEDRYQAQQSIRTWFNRSHPERAYVKTALSILNMGFMRGLSTEYMQATPAINQWLAALIRADPVLCRCGFGTLREVAAIGYRQPQYQRATRANSPYRKLLAALWRESPIPGLRPGQRTMTMAALLHIDAMGRSLMASLVTGSEMTPLAWLQSYLEAYLRPLLHCFFAYGLVFMPHGENVILIVERDRVSGVLLKDIGEEIAVMDPGQRLPAQLSRIAVSVPQNLQPLSIFTDIFDGFLRFLAPIMDLHLRLDETLFWAAVADTIKTYQQQHPELANRFAGCDLFVEHFPRSCLNRLQLKNNQQMVDLADPAASLQLVGQLANPVARSGHTILHQGAPVYGKTSQPDAAMPAATPADGQSGADAGQSSDRSTGHR
ncbi:IucA/IucC family protein [Frateuria aurantia]